MATNGPGSCPKLLIIPTPRKDTIRLSQLSLSFFFLGGGGAGGGGGGSGGCGGVWVGLLCEGVGWRVT